MATKLDKQLKREIDVDGKPYMLAITPEGLKLTEKGKRKGQELSWKNLLAGQAAQATVLNATTDTAEEAVKVWMNSPGHRANILTCAYKETGLALVDDQEDVPMKGNSQPYEYYWTQEFALPLKAEH